jgi:hypothetical protein
MTLDQMITIGEATDESDQWEFFRAVGRALLPVAGLDRAKLNAYCDAGAYFEAALLIMAFSLGSEWRWMILADDGATVFRRTSKGLMTSCHSATCTTRRPPAVALLLAALDTLRTEAANA